MGREQSSWVWVAIGAACALSVACGARTIHWDVTGPESRWATVYIKQKEPTFEVLAVDGANEYPTADGGSLSFGGDFKKLAIRVMPGVHEVTLVCRYEIDYRAHRKSWGRLRIKQFAEREVTRSVSLGPDAEEVLDFDVVCPDEPPCEYGECDNVFEFHDREFAPVPKR